MGAVTRNDAPKALSYDRVVVLAIAVEQYQNAPKRPEIVQVDHARADAESFVETIEQIYDGIAAVDSHTLTDGHATLGTIADEAEYIISNLAPTDLFIFYYAGHGCQIEGANRLTAWDTNPLQLGSSTIDLNDGLIAKIKVSACTRALLFIDACAESIKTLAKTRSLIFDLSKSEIEKKLEGGDYLAVYLSCSDGEKSYGSEALGHGIFTWHLLRALNGTDPRALERDRWMTDVSLRDWLESAVQSYITTRTNIRGKQTPRAIIHSSHTFRIRHVPEPPATAAATLADLGLKNAEAFLEGVQTGSIKRLPGFKRGNFVPTDINDHAANWIGGLLESQLQEELEELFQVAKVALGFKRREGSVSISGGDGSVDTPAFRFWVICDQDPDDPGEWRIRRRLDLRDGWEDRREEIEEAIAGLDLDRFIVTFEKRHASYDKVADALEDLAGREGDDFHERPTERKLTYSRDDMTITFDFDAGEVEFSVSGENNLELVETTQTVSLGWTNPSPMLAAAAPAELPDLRDEVDEASSNSRGKPKLRR